ncbi:type IV toxin-antitoxin system AbiEi family antitoxin domain-containing protein [Roseomonas sp. USHLN139]|uniref:type IV toxin-antitoxin system AbiEi family antitoxin domain-containing protein n=1 Tax=Roseomonas sp. USHLN139 TaxID=3081298 RepID=UPI003B026993
MLECDDDVLRLLDGPPLVPPGFEPQEPNRVAVTGRLTELRVADTCRRAPRAVLCLTTAAYTCGLLREPPPVAWLALPQGANAVRVFEGDHRWIRWSYPGAFTVGITEYDVLGARVRWTDPARTVVDLVRYGRHLRSLGPAVEAARRYAETGGDLDVLATVAADVGAPAAVMESIAMLVMLLRS